MLSTGRGSGAAGVGSQKSQLRTQNRPQNLLWPASLPFRKCLFSAASVLKLALSCSLLFVTSDFAQILLILSISSQKDRKDKIRDDVCLVEENQHIEWWPSVAPRIYISKIPSDSFSPLLAGLQMNFIGNQIEFCAT